MARALTQTGANVDYPDMAKTLRRRRFRDLLRRILRRRRLRSGPPPPPGPDEGGVREPRRPAPVAGAGAVALPEDEG